MSFLQQRLQQQRTKCYYQNQKKDKKRKSKTGLPKPERDNTIVSHTPDEVQTVDTQLQTTADRKHTCSNNKITAEYHKQSAEYYQTQTKQSVKKGEDYSMGWRQA